MSTIQFLSQLQNMEMLDKSVGLVGGEAIAALGVRNTNHRQGSGDEALGKRPGRELAASRDPSANFLVRGG